MIYGIEHPDITRTLRTGYPFKPIVIKTIGRCEGCGEAIKEDEEFLEHPDGLIHDDWECAYLLVKKQAE